MARLAIDPDAETHEQALGSHSPGTLTTQVVGALAQHTSSRGRSRGSWAWGVAVVAVCGHAAPDTYPFSMLR